jgi:glutaredoxin
MNGKYLARLFFLVISALGSLYLLTEVVLQSQGRSICADEGCKVVAQYTRFGDNAIVVPGLAVLVVLALLTAKDLRTVSMTRERIVNMLLVAALAAEGFFVGYQLVWLSTVCVFCLSVFGIFVTLGILRVLAGQQEVLAGFGSLAVLYALFFLVLPAGGSALPQNRQYILFASADCKHCAEIRKELEKRQLDVQYVAVKEHAVTLRNLGIEHVPTLLVNGTAEKVFLTGNDAIRRHLACGPVQKTSGARKHPGKSSTTSQNTPVPSAALTEGNLNLFAPSGQNPLFNPLPDDGMCKEDVKCD